MRRNWSVDSDENRLHEKFERDNKKLWWHQWRNNEPLCVTLNERAHKAINTCGSRCMFRQKWFQPIDLLWMCKTDGTLSIAWNAKYSLIVVGNMWLTWNGMIPNWLPIVYLWSIECAEIFQKFVLLFQIPSTRRMHTRNVCNESKRYRYTASQQLLQTMAV